MITVAAADFQRDLGHYENEALREPVTIVRDGRERLVMLSAEGYQRLERRDRQVWRAQGPSDADLAAIAAVEMDPRHGSWIAN